MTTHFAIAATAKGQFDAVQVKTETTPGDGKVLIEVAYASMVAFDTYITDLGLGVVEYPVVLGLNVSGTVKEAGGASHLSIGDRVIGFSIYGGGKKDALQGTIQEYIVLPAYLIPDTLSLESAATIPDNFITSFFSLFDHLSLSIPQSFPAPSVPANHDVSILIYGAGTTTGQYALQLLRLAGYTNVLATASQRHHDFLRSLGAKHVFDYRSANLTSEIRAVLGPDSTGVELALDGVTAEDTLARIGQVLSPRGTVALLLPIKVGDAVAVGDAGMRWEIPPQSNPFTAETNMSYVRTFHYDENEYLKQHLMPEILPQLLAADLIQPNRVRLLDQGTLKQRVEIGLNLLRNNKVSGEKVIVKVSE
ncbi:PKS-ER domain-containing protein [Mycena indigotica]|uniref:PKS-ER domain-containing protein n=1 Tax=Mycena indigotica TaxID=2126181 RepID=A0A8H6W8V1_9AGAR|nr:PKS-ER domain-containing protein [Mycena indigotica]KAF7310004.1 PKS-ER domain-containing protein [Mycena indigotica]